MNTAGVSGKDLNDRLAALLARMAAGDEAALSDLYDLTVGQVFAVARQMVGDLAAAEDVVVEVYFQVWRQATDYNPVRGTPMTWLLVICRSRCLDFLRQRRRIDSALEPLDQQKDQGSSRDNPLDLLQVFERHSAVHAAMTRLSSNQRQLFALHFFKGLSHQEISDRLRLPLGTVKSHLRRGITLLHDLLIHHRTNT